jgi:hypothetical protein
LNKKANLFVVGAMKAGTTSFVDLLSLQDEIYVSPIKEPHYFVNELPTSIYKPSRFFDMNAYFEKDFPMPLHIAKLNNRGHYDKLYSLAESNHKYLVDASTCYLNSPESAKHIFDYNREAKIIILIRDPLKRAISHHQMDLGLGRILRSFEDEIKDNIEDYKNDRLSNWSYLNMSFFNQQIKNFEKFFGEQVLILQFENLIKNDQQEFNNLNQFLELSNELTKLPVKNETRKLYFPGVNNLLIKIGFKDVFSKLIPNEIKQRVFKFITTQQKNNTPISEETLAILKRLFQKNATSKTNHKK